MMYKNSTENVAWTLKRRRNNVMCHLGKEKSSSSKKLYVDNFEIEEVDHAFLWQIS